MENLKDDVRAYLSRNEIGPYLIDESILQWTVNQYPDHKNHEAVVAKVKMLNLFYSTGIQAIDAMAVNILRIENIDKILAEPKYSAKLVNAIAKLDVEGGTRNNYSFATKYCALHKPTKYPIYDSIVAAVFTKLMMKENGLPPFVYSRKKELKDEWQMTKTEFEQKLRDYDFYVKVYDLFMENYGLTGHFNYREVDWYLWGSFKEVGKLNKIEELAPIDASKYVEYSAPKIRDKYIL